VAGHEGDVARSWRPGGAKEIIGSTGKGQAGSRRRTPVAAAVQLGEMSRPARGRALAGIIVVEALWPPNDFGRYVDNRQEPSLPNSFSFRCYAARNQPSR
jgi:hypothetical protein